MRARSRPLRQHPVHGQYLRPPAVLRDTKIALMPSLCCENQPLVVVEAMINGIPVIASDRGGMPEAFGDCGFACPSPTE